MRDAASTLAVVETRVDDLRRRAGDLLTATRQELAERARLARIGDARLFSNVIALRGSAAARLRVRRVRAGGVVALPFEAWMGVTRCVTDAADVQAAWAQLLAREQAAPEGMLRGQPSTILDVPHATVSRRTSSELEVALQPRGQPSPASPVVLAVPRFVHALTPRKLSNVSHWLLDCLPQVVALESVAPGAHVLLPQTLQEFQRVTLALAGLTPAQMVPWDGTSIAGDRLLIFESDGRLGGGRPLSSLLELRRVVAAPRPAADAPAGRRIYVSRRDARKKRQWASNAPAIEALFASRGFEIVCPTDLPLPALVRMFREAAVVAGLNGAGLAHILFTPPGAQVIVLLTTSLVRWYARTEDARSLWLSDRHAASGELAALGDSPRFYAHVAAAFEQDRHSFVSGDDVPLDRLGEFLDDALVGRSTE